MKPYRHYVLESNWWSEHYGIYYVSQDTNIRVTAEADLLWM